MRAATPSRMAITRRRLSLRSLGRNKKKAKKTVDSTSGVSYITNYQQGYRRILKSVSDAAAGWVDEFIRVSQEYGIP